MVLLILKNKNLVRVPDTSLTLLSSSDYVILLNMERGRVLRNREMEYVLISLEEHISVTLLFL